MNKEPKLWTALITPFKNGSVDYISLEKLIQQQVDAQNGILLLGSTGEALNLDLAVKKEILEFAIKLQPETALMGGVGGHCLSETLEWVGYLETLPLSHYLLVTPLYAKPGIVGQTQWFTSLMDKATKKCVLYNVPSRTGLKLAPEALKNCVGHPQFHGLKEASGSVDEFQEYSKIVHEQNNKMIYSGDDALLPQFAPHQCNGLISVASNVWPLATHQYVQMSLESTLNDDDKKLWEEATNSLFCASNPIPVKALMNQLDIITCPDLIMPLTIEDLPTEHKLMDYHHQICKWYTAHN
jgi:4-hydroxy-tetrahydrodipicolinate synthase